MNAVDTDHEGRDAADYKEAQCDAVLPSDSLEDMIADATAHERLSRKSIVNLSAVFNRLLSEVQDDHSKNKSMAKEFFEVLRAIEPPIAPLRAWWALQFAIESPSTSDKTKDGVAGLLCIRRETFQRDVALWRKKLKLRKLPPSYSEAVRIGHHKRRTKKELKRERAMVAV